MNKKTVKVLMLCFSFMLFSLAAYSKDPPTPGQKSNDTSTPPPPGNELPIDGGLSLLLASGVAYGVYTLKRKKE